MCDRGWDSAGQVRLEPSQCHALKQAARGREGGEAQREREKESKRERLAEV